MIWVVSNTYEHENTSNEWWFLHFKPWKQRIEMYHHFSLILCYFWRQNCLKTSILALWATLVNTCWPYVYDMTKWTLGTCKSLCKVPAPQISRQEIQNSSRGVEKTIFFVSTVDWWNNHLHSSSLKSQSTSRSCLGTYNVNFLELFKLTVSLSNETARFSELHPVLLMFRNVSFFFVTWNDPGFALRRKAIYSSNSFHMTRTTFFFDKTESL